MISFIIICIIHYFIFWPYILLGSFISVGSAEFITLYLIPIVYLLYIGYNECILNIAENEIIIDNKEVGEKKRDDVINIVHNPIKMEPNTTLILGYIIASYMILLNKKQ